MLAVKVFDGITNRLGRTSQAPGNPAAYFGQGTAADPRQPFSSLQDFLPLRIRQLRKATAAFDPVLIGGQKALDDRLAIADLSAPVVDDPAADEAALTPATDRFGRDVEPIADL